jgi:hypothetical protein
MAWTPSSYEDMKISSRIKVKWKKLYYTTNVSIHIKQNCYLIKYCYLICVRLK